MHDQHLVGAGHVDGAQDPMIDRIADQPGVATPGFARFAEMLLRMDLSRLAQRQGGTDGVGPAAVLAPAGSRHDPIGDHLVGERRVAIGGEERAPGIAGDEHRARAGEMADGRRDANLDRFVECVVRPVKPIERFAGDAHGRGAAARIDPLLDAPPPGVQDDVPDADAVDRASAEEAFPRATDPAEIIARVQIPKRNVLHSRFPPAGLALKGVVPFAPASDAPRDRASVGAAATLSGQMTATANANKPARAGK
jgi:hypothetical protein